ncbi:MAG TPA: DUF4433 domain-containing protein [Archangium sp.]|nr:DUF4433 domain-containing protein [Archangium sp.]
MTRISPTADLGGKEEQEKLNNESGSILREMGLDGDVAKTLAPGDDQPQRLVDDLGLTPEQLQEVAKNHPEMFEAPGLAQGSSAGLDLSAVEPLRSTGIAAAGAPIFVDRTEPCVTDIFHFTHIGNLPTILADGGLWSDSDCASRQKTVARSGSTEIKQRRLAMPIEAGVGRGGVVGDYVPFYYAPRSPMLYSISRGNVPGVQPDQDSLVYLVARAEDFTPPNFVVTDGNAAAGFTSHYGTHQDIATYVDWAVMRATYWNNTDEDGDRMRRRAAEFLVHQFVSWTAIRSVITRTEATKKAVEALYRQQNSLHQPPVTVNSSWHY